MGWASLVQVVAAIIADVPAMDAFVDSGDGERCVFSICHNTPKARPVKGELWGRNGGKGFRIWLPTREPQQQAFRGPPG